MTITQSLSFIWTWAIYWRLSLVFGGKACMAVTLFIERHSITRGVAASE